MADNHPQDPQTAKAKSPEPEWSPMPHSLLEHIYASDQAIYPAPDLTFTRLHSWATACPELFLCLGRHDDVGTHQHTTTTDLETAASFDGVIIVLPLLKDAWEALLAGQIHEHDIDPVSMFATAATAAAGKGKSEDSLVVGLHVFHVERLAGRARNGFTAMALDEVRRVVESCSAGRWEVAGYSGESSSFFFFFLAPNDCVRRNMGCLTSGLPVDKDNSSSYCYAARKGCFQTPCFHENVHRGLWG